MKIRGKLLGMAVVGLTAAGWSLLAPAQQDDSGPMSYAVSVEQSINDNRDGTATDVETLLESRVRARVAVKANLRGRTDLEAYYSPALLYRDNPRFDQNSVDVYHDLGLNVGHNMSERVALSFNDYLNYTDDPAVMEEGRTFRENASYLLNRASVGGTYQVLVGRAIISVKGSHLYKSYTDEAYAQMGDESGFGVQTGFKYMTQSQVGLLADVAYHTSSLGTESKYLDAQRGVDVLFAGLGAEKAFGRWSARARAGIDLANFQNASIDSLNRPAADLEVAFRPSGEGGSTRFIFAAQRHVLRGDISPYASQDRTTVSVAAERKFGARFLMSVWAVYADGSYQADTTALDASGNPVDPAKIDGSDTLAGVQLEASYEIRKGLTLEAGYGYEDWSSDEHIRTPHTRNTARVAVKLLF